MSDLIATRYQLRSEFYGHEIQAVTFDRMVSPFYEGEKWAVRRGSFCLAKDSEWEFEPLPSSRNDDFYDRCRFDSLNEAQIVFVRTLTDTGLTQKQ